MKLPYGNLFGRNSVAESPVISPDEFSQKVAYSRAEAEKILNAADRKSVV